MFSTRSVPRCYKRDKLEDAGQAVRKVVCCCEMAASLGISLWKWSELVGKCSEIGDSQRGREAEGIICEDTEN
jgi:hypothetical protein